MLRVAGVVALFPSLLIDRPTSAKDQSAPVESVKQPRFIETGKGTSTEPGTGKLIRFELRVRATLPDGKTIEEQIDFLKLSTDIISQTKRFFEARMIGNGTVLTMDEKEVRVFSLGIEGEHIKPQLMQRYDHTSHASENFVGKKEIIQVAVDTARYADWKDAVLATITRDGFFHVWNAGRGNGTYLDLELMLKRRKWPTQQIQTASIYLRGSDWFILPIGMPGANVNFGYSLRLKTGGMIDPEPPISVVPTGFGDYDLKNFFVMADGLTDAGSEGSAGSVKATVHCEKDDGTLKFGFTLILEPVR